MRRYEKYKDSGVEWIGEIPEEWEVKRIAFELTFGRGLSITKEDLKDEGIPCVNYGEIHSKFGFRVNPEIHNLKCVHTSYLESDERALLKRGDFIFADTSEDIKGSGNFTFLDSEIPTFAGYHTIIARIVGKNEASYLSYYFDSIHFRNQIRSEVSGIKVFSITQAILKKASLLSPPLNEQTAIATYLDHKTAEIDALITDKKRLMELYEEEKSAIINEAVTKGLASTRLASTRLASTRLASTSSAAGRGVGSKKKKVLDESAAGGGVRMKDSGIEWMGDIPEHWEVKKMKLLVSKIGSGITPSGGSAVYSTNGIPLLRSQNIHFDGLKLDDVAYISEEIDNSMSNSRVIENDVLVNITGASIGRCFYVPRGFGRGNVNQHVCILRPKMEFISSKYLYYLMRSIIGQEQINLQQTGANREGLNFEQLKNFNLPIPTSTSEQEFIVQYIEAETHRIDTKKERTQKLIDLLTEYRTALISEVVTGKVKVV